MSGEVGPARAGSLPSGQSLGRRQMRKKGKEKGRHGLGEGSDAKWPDPRVKGSCMAVVMILKMSVWKLAVSVIPHSSSI